MLGFSRKEVAQSGMPGKWETYCKEAFPALSGCRGKSSDNAVPIHSFVATEIIGSFADKQDEHLKQDDHLVQVKFAENESETEQIWLAKKPQDWMVRKPQDWMEEKPGSELNKAIRFLQESCDTGLKMAFGFDSSRAQADGPIHLVADQETKDRTIWFLGDIHGDIVALRAAIAFANSNSLRKPTFVFLGDLIDRHDYSFEVVMEVVKLLQEDPESVFWIVGNHDRALYWDEDKECFGSKVTPQHFFQDLNYCLKNDSVKNMMRNLIEIIRRLPVGLAFKDGLFVSHGGIPSPKDLREPNMWFDKGKIRKTIIEKKEEFISNRAGFDNYSKYGGSFSWLEIANFRAAFGLAYGIDIKWMLRGHDHCKLYRHRWDSCDERAEDSLNKAAGKTVAENAKVDVLTMTTMLLIERGEANSFSSAGRRFFCPSVARYEQGGKPVVFSFQFDDDDAHSWCREVWNRHWNCMLPLVEKFLEGLEKEREDKENDTVAVAEEVRKCESEVQSANTAIAKIEIEIKQLQGQNNEANLPHSVKTKPSSGRREGSASSAGRGVEPRRLADFLAKETEQNVRTARVFEKDLEERRRRLSELCTEKKNHEVAQEKAIREQTELAQEISDLEKRIKVQTRRVDWIKQNLGNE